MCAIQSLGGTGALYIGSIFLNNFLKGRTIYISNPTWGKFFKIFIYDLHIKTEYFFKNPRKSQKYF